jgi:hypothetical protein
VRNYKSTDKWFPGAAGGVIKRDCVIVRRFLLGTKKKYSEAGLIVTIIQNCKCKSCY